MIGLSRCAGLSRRAYLAGTSAAVAIGCRSRPGRDGAVNVYAAASLTGALSRVGEAWRAAAGTTCSFVFDASSRLAQQIEAGAPADVFVSADSAWMDALAESHLLDRDSRRDLLGNRVVVVVPRRASAALHTVEDLASLSRIALAGPAVPAGRYARASLRALGVWDAVASRVTEGDNVRAALAWVERGEADAAIVYATDATASAEVRVAFELPSSSHPPIVVPFAVLAASPRIELARAFAEFCAGDEARAIFVAAGFEVL